MTYFCPQYMAEDVRQEFLDWVTNEGLDINQISADDFSVHNGWISGYRFLLTETGNKAGWKGKTTKVHFTQRQQHPLPKGLTIE